MKEYYINMIEEIIERYPSHFSLTDEQKLELRNMDEDELEEKYNSFCFVAQTLK